MPTRTRTRTRRTQTAKRQMQRRGGTRRLRNSKQTSRRRRMLGGSLEEWTFEPKSDVLQNVKDNDNFSGKVGIVKKDGMEYPAYVNQKQFYANIGNETTTHIYKNKDKEKYLPINVPTEMTIVQIASKTRSQSTGDINAPPVRTRSFFGRTGRSASEGQNLVNTKPPDLDNLDMRSNAQKTASVVKTVASIPFKPITWLAKKSAETYQKGAVSAPNRAVAGSR
jgi:hypothetical protein